MKTMVIEDAIRWAVRDELPKVGADVVGGWIRAGAPNGAASPALAASVAGQMGASVDARTNRYGVVPDFGALGRLEPHPAAVAIGEAMLALDGIEAGGFADWEAFDDLAGLGDDPVAGPLLAEARRDAQAQAGTMARMTGSLSALMVKRAVLGPPSGWEIGEVRAVVERCPRTGNPMWFRKERRAVAWNDRDEAIAWDDIEVDGFNAKSRRPWPDAYRRSVLDPDPLLAVLARAEWQLWRAALDVLFEDVAACEAVALGGVAVSPSRLPMRPWVEGMPAQPRVLGGGEALPVAAPKEFAQRRRRRA
jgi:hypothetical protein